LEFFQAIKVAMALTVQITAAVELPVPILQLMDNSMEVPAEIRDQAADLVVVAAVALHQFSISME
jgi:hypothetical protein